MNHCQKVLHALRRGPVTSKGMIEQYNIYRLAARIKDLRNKGYVIYTEYVTVRNGQYRRYAKYHLLSEPGDQYENAA